MVPGTRIQSWRTVRFDQGPRGRKDHHAPGVIWMKLSTDLRTGVILCAVIVTGGVVASRRPFAMLVRTPLWKVFWLLGVAPSCALWATLAWMLLSEVSPAAILGMAGVLLLFTVAIVAAVWASSANAVDRRFGILAKALTVAWAINSALLLFFITVSLVE